MLKKVNVDFSGKLVGVGDTLPVFRSVFSDEKSHSLSNLCKSTMNHLFNAHDSEADCEALKKITKHAMAQDSFTFQGHCHTVESCSDDETFKEQEHSNFETLLPLVNSSIINKPMAIKIAGSGLSYGHLKTIHERNGVDGIFAVFKAKNANGKGRRVTNANKIILAVF